jgi:recombination DNA repair RAD52 pathway protein
MSKLRIGSIMEFDSVKSRREAYDCGRKQGVVEELKRQLKVYKEVKSNLEKDNGFSDYISGQLFAVKMVIFGLENRLKELEEVKKERIKELKERGV